MVHDELDCTHSWAAEETFEQRVVDEEGLDDSGDICPTEVTEFTEARRPCN